MTPTTRALKPRQGGSIPLPLADTSTGPAGFRASIMGLKRVIVTPAVYLRFIEFLHVDIQGTGQKSHCVNTR